MDTASTKLKPKDLAAEWGVDVEAVLRLIHNGDLRAVDIASSRGRPRWIIDRADVVAFEKARENAKPPPRQSRRQYRSEKPRIKYYPE